MFILLINFLFFISIIALVFLQTSRSILIRTAGLFIIDIAIILFSFVYKSMDEFIFISIVASLLGILAFLSDYYSASLRTWFFYVSRDSIRITYFGILFSLLCFGFFFPRAIALSLLVGTLFGSVLGELKEKDKKDFTRMLKSVLGTMIGLYGMATKILFGFVMIELFYIII